MDGRWEKRRWDVGEEGGGEGGGRKRREGGRLEKGEGNGREDYPVRPLRHSSPNFVVVVNNIDVTWSSASLWAFYFIHHKNLKKNIFIFSVF